MIKNIEIDFKLKKKVSGTYGKNNLANQFPVKLMCRAAPPKTANNSQMSL